MKMLLLASLAFAASTTFAEPENQFALAPVKSENFYYGDSSPAPVVTKETADIRERLSAFEELRQPDAKRIPASSETVPPEIIQAQRNESQFWTYFFLGAAAGVNRTTQAIQASQPRNIRCTSNAVGQSVITNCN